MTARSRAVAATQLCRVYASTASAAPPGSAPRSDGGEHRVEVAALALGIRAEALVRLADELPHALVGRERAGRDEGGPARVVGEAIGVGLHRRQLRRGRLRNVSWELGFGIAMAGLAVVAAAAIVLLLVFGARKDGQRNDEVQAQVRAGGSGTTDA
jgi:hypothetical protein